MKDLRDAKNADSLEMDELMTEESGGMDPAACPDCDGTLVPNGAIAPADADSGRVRRHCSRCERSVEQRWVLDRVAVAGTGDDRQFDTLLENCPDCESPLDAVGNFFDHHDGSGRQQRACDDCAVDIDEWWHFRETTTDESQ